MLSIVYADRPLRIFLRYSKIVARIALSASEDAGRTLGNVYSAGAAGGIVGTFLTGFYLVPSAGTSQILFVAAAVFGLMAVAYALPVIKGCSASVSPTRAAAAPDKENARLWARSAVALFVAGLAIMSLELAVLRMVSANLGQSLVTWTSIIGVTLAGLSVGSHWVGLAARKSQPTRVLVRKAYTAKAYLALAARNIR